MSDKNKIPLVDRGWSQMATTLDTELPQKDKRRRPIIWFFLMFGILISTAYILFPADNGELSKKESSELIADNIDKGTPAIHQANNKTTVSKIVHSDPKTSEIGNQKNRLDQVEIETKTEQHNNSNDLNKEKSGSFSQGDQQMKMSEIELKSTRIINNHTEAVSKHRNIKELEPELQISPSIIASSELSSSLIEGKSSLEIDNGAQNISQNSKHSNALVSISPLSVSLNTVIYRSTPSFNYNQSWSENLTPLIINKSSSITASNYISMGGLYDVRPSGLGFQVGVGQSLKFKKFELFGELGYANVRFVKESEIENQVSLSFEQDEIEVSNSDNIEEQDVLDQRNKVNRAHIQDETFITQLDYIYARLGVSKSIFGKLSAKTGLSLARFLSIRNQSISFQSNVAEYQSELDGFALTSSEYFENDKFSKYELSSTLGLTYTFSRTFEIDADYRIGFTNLFSNPEDSPESNDTNGLVTGEGSGVNNPLLNRSGLELKLRYNF